MLGIVARSSMGHSLFIRKSEVGCEALSLFQEIGEHWGTMHSRSAAPLKPTPSVPSPSGNDKWVRFVVETWCGPGYQTIETSDNET